MTRRTKVVVLVVAVVAIAAIVFAGTAPHPWVGRLVCEVRGGEWTNRSSTETESIVTSGYRCKGI